MGEWRRLSFCEKTPRTRGDYRGKDKWATKIDDRIIIISIRQAG